MFCPILYFRYSAELLLWKNQKGWTRYPMVLFKRNSTADILLGILHFFWRRYLTKQLQTTDYKGLLFVQNAKRKLFLQDCAWATATMYQEKYCDYFESSCKILQRSKRNESIFLCVFWKKSQKFLEIYRKEPVLKSFYCKVVAWNRLLKTKKESKG